MSRTLNTMPSHVRKYHWVGRKPPRGIAATIPTQRPRRSRYNRPEVVIDWLPYDAVDHDPAFWGNSVPAQFRRDLNRRRRHIDNQAVRTGNYDLIARHRRDAAWLYD